MDEKISMTNKLKKKYQTELNTLKLESEDFRLKYANKMNSIIGSNAIIKMV